MCVDKTAVAALLGRLVACPSVNPGAGREAGPVHGERAMAGVLDPLLRDWGARTQLVELAPGRCNLVATWPGQDAGRSLLLDAHMDTVGVEGMTVAPFTPEIREGRLYGRGACDTKGPMAAMLLAIRRILDEDGRLPVTVHFAATGDEEDGAMGAAQLAGSDLPFDAVIVAEPTDLKIVYAHKGACRFRVDLTGKAAHSSLPWLGVNAVEAAAELVGVIRREFLRQVRHQDHPELGRASVCVSTIEGGTRVNIVPERCRFEVDCRCLPGERKERLESAMETMLGAVRESFPMLQARFDVYQWYPALDGKSSDPFVSLMSGACRSALGCCEQETAPYATDGGFFSQRGAPGIVFGPGSIRQAHTADEFIDLNQVEQAVGTYAAMIRAFAAHSIPEGEGR